MITKNWQHEPLFHQSDAFQVVQLLDKPEAHILHMSILPGQEVKPHITPVDVAFFILEGSLTITIGEETLLCETGTMIESPKGIPHGLRNLTNQPIRLLVMKLPKP